ncbi:MAG: hypothetical protein MRY79_06850, partial [Alphaproteobacteria bacterium]|nr:hypothetical protein [Alphaproteobacteria bacterium]
IAYNMVSRYGFSDKVGYVNLTDPSLAKNGEGAEIAFKEVQRFIQEAYNEAHSLLETHRSALIKLAKTLAKKETLERDEVIKTTGITPTKPRFKRLADIKLT